MTYDVRPVPTPFPGGQIPTLRKYRSPSLQKTTSLVYSDHRIKTAFLTLEGTYHQSVVKICAEHHKEAKALTESKEPNHRAKCAKAERLFVEITGF